MIGTVEEAIAAYIDCALWSSTTMDDEPMPLDEDYNSDDLTEQAWDSMRTDVIAFCDANSADIENMQATQVGHDFWLTRNGHGAGFWDRGLGALGDRLTSAAHAYGSCDLYVGDDDKLYIQ